MVRGLLLRGADPSIENMDGKIPIDFLESYTNKEDKAKFTDLLRKNDSDNARAKMGFCERNNPMN